MLSERGLAGRDVGANLASSAAMAAKFASQSAAVWAPVSLRTTMRVVLATPVVLSVSTSWVWGARAARVSIHTPTLSMSMSLPAGTW